MDQATLAGGHDLYVTMGTASASLIGLLFAAISINVDAVTGCVDAAMSRSRRATTHLEPR